jgi:hypothetical protein
MLLSLLLCASSVWALGVDVLWYSGNSGLKPTDLGTTASTFESAVKGQGATKVTYTSTWPSSFSSYSLAVLSVSESTYSAAYASDLEDFIADGGIVVMIGESSSVSSTTDDTFNSLLTELGHKTKFKQGSYDSSCDRYATRATTHDLTTGASSIVYAMAGGITVGTGGEELYTQEGGQVLVAVESGVVLVSDINVFIEECTLSSGSERFFENLYNYASGGGCSDPDADNDGYESEACGGDDCDDDDADVNPGEYRYEDSDRDGVGNSNEREDACSAPSSWVEEGGDCDDNDPDVQENTGPYYEDGDDDGYGDPDQASDDCDGGKGLVDNDEDCDDHDDEIYPGAPEYCDGDDNDCDGKTDNNAVDAVTYYYDGDEDGYGDDDDTETTCDQPEWYVEKGGDCADGNPKIYPGTKDYEETCADEVDRDKNGKGGEDDPAADCACPLSESAALMLPLVLLARSRRSRR